ncbi:MAG: hypothetical protein ACKODN_00455 [Actinomycetota bacterium]
MKENIIIGKVIPAGTGMDSYNLFGIDYPGYVRPQSHTTEGDEGVEVDESVFGTASSSSSSNAATVADFQAVMGTGSGQGSDDAESDADNA